MCMRADEGGSRSLNTCASTVLMVIVKDALAKNKFKWQCCMDCCLAFGTMSLVKVSQQQPNCAYNAPSLGAVPDPCASA